MLKDLARIAFVVMVLAGAAFVGIGFFPNSVSSREIAHTDDGDLWQDIDESSLAQSGERQIVPDSYRTLRLNHDRLRELLAQAPLESRARVASSESVVSLPLPNGRFSRFRIVESPIMEDTLQAQYPEIRTYLGQGIDDPTATTRFDLTPKGFHALILSGDGSVFIDPYSKDDADNYVSYYKRDFQKTDRSFACLVSNSVPNALEKKRLDDQMFPFNDLVNNAGTLRTYRLAMAATGEYTTFHGGTVPLAMAAITTSMNRVNAVYERDLSVRMNLVANNNLIVYTNGATDPYTNNDGFAMLTENQANLTAVIGSANYDVGHVFSTGGGGVAALNSPCNAGESPGRNRLAGACWRSVRH